MTNMSASYMVPVGLKPIWIEQIAHFLSHEYKTGPGNTVSQRDNTAKHLIAAPPLPPTTEGCGTNATI